MGVEKMSRLRIGPIPRRLSSLHPSGFQMGIDDDVDDAAHHFRRLFSVRRAGFVDVVPSLFHLVQTVEFLSQELDAARIGLRIVTCWQISVDLINRTIDQSHNHRRNR